MSARIITIDGLCRAASSRRLRAAAAKPVYTDHTVGTHFINMVAAFGSGRHRASLPRLFTDAVPNVDINTLAKAGALVPGAVMAWKYPTNPPLGLASRGEQTRVILTVAGIETAVDLVRQDRYLGGTEPFFDAPCCGTLRRILYVLDGRLVCRACGRLEYRSRYELWWAPALR